MEPVVTWWELQAWGTREVSIIRDYLSPERALRLGDGALRDQVRRQLKTDWALQPTVIAGQPITVHMAVNTLGYSRRFHFWRTDSADAEHTYVALVRGFEWFDGRLVACLKTILNVDLGLLTTL